MLVITDLTYRIGGRTLLDSATVALSAGGGSVLRRFTLEPEQWLARACREAGRTLTREEFEEVLPGRPYTPACA